MGPIRQRDDPFDGTPFDPADFLVFDIGGFEVVVGRNARANDRLSLKLARPRDHWLHAAGVPGSHVVVRLPEGVESAPRDVLEAAARFAVRHSKARSATGKVPVHLARACDVGKERGAPAGQVTLRRFETLRVYPGQD